MEANRLSQTLRAEVEGLAECAEGTDEWEVIDGPAKAGFKQEGVCDAKCGQADKQPFGMK